MAGPFKLKGWSGYQASPARDHEKDKDGNVIEPNVKHDVDSENKAAFEKLKNDRYKAIVAKYTRGSKLTDAEKAIMAEYAEKSKKKKDD
jgi:hypothetical protein